MENEMESYLRQYQIHPLLINRIQTETNRNYSSPMFNSIQRPTIILNRNFSDREQQFSSEELRGKLRKQLEYYFSRENLINDVYLQSQMDSENYVPISLIANFKLVKRLTQDLQLIIDVLKESSLVEVDNEEKKVRSLDNKIDFSKRKRCIIILRNVPLNANENEILFLFQNESCSVKPIECEKILEVDHSDCWYVTFNSEDDAQTAFLYLTRENISIRGQKILARMKTRLWEKPMNFSLTKKTSFSPMSTNSLSNFFGFVPQEINYRQQQLPINYNNLSLNQHNFRSTISQPININHQQQQTQFLTRFHPIFPTNFWYLPSTNDSYLPMAYNGNNKTKTRISTLKTRKSTTNNEEIKVAENNSSQDSEKNISAIEQSLANCSNEMVHE